MLQIKQERIIEIRMGFDYSLSEKIIHTYSLSQFETCIFYVIIGSEKKSAFIIPVGQILSS